MNFCEPLFDWLKFWEKCPQVVQAYFRVKVVIGVIDCVRQILGGEFFESLM